ncbi:PREDICTED: translation initiation factor IF-2-like [Capra hircus]|uniref:translation initiation factor IF-2-like n=1 Tax=Capra hircus TaxID=9925 RepID=UPI000846B700|nr:PREDICTED: translation initiation factor IF-2-like [Capra hircus]
MFAKSCRCINPAAGSGGHPTAAICKGDPKLGAQPTRRRETQALRSGFPEPNPAKLATCVEEEGKFWRWSCEPLYSREGGRSRQGDGSPGSGARNSEARRDVPGPVGRRSFLKDKAGQPWALARTSRGPPWAESGEVNKGAKRVSRRQAADLTRGWGLAPGLPPGIPDPGTRPDPSDRRRPGRGPRVPRKPQAAQVEPGWRHRKSRALSLPFLRGDLLTGKPEVPQTGGSQLTSRPRHAAPEALQLRGPRRAASGGGGGRPRPSRSGRGKGRGSGESRAGKLRRAAVRRGGGANGLRWLPPRWPPRGALWRPVGPRRRVAERRGAELPVASSPLQKVSGSLGLVSCRFPIVRSAPSRFVVNSSALRAPRTYGCTHAQRVLHGVYTFGVLLLKAPTLHVEAAAQPVLARPPASGTRPPARVSPPRWSPLLAHGSASREEKRHPSVLGGKLPGSSERKPLTTTLGGPNNILLSRSTRVYPSTY